MFGQVCRTVLRGICLKHVRRMSESVSPQSHDMFLYWASGSVPCWKVLMCLKEKEISGYQEKRLNFTLRDLKSEELMSMNPRGQVPTFKHGDCVVNESSAICLYLEHTFKNQGTKLLPDDSKARAQVMQKMFEVQNIEYHIVKAIMHVWFLFKKEDIDMEKLEPKYKIARREIKLWADYISEQQGYLTGTEFNMADICFFPHLANMHRYGLDLDKFPALKAYYDKVKDRSSVLLTWPPHWSEKPGNKLILGPV